MKLRVEQYGAGVDLFLKEITKDQLTRFEEACSVFMGIYRKKSLDKLWYQNEAKMQKLFGVRSYRQMKSGNHRYHGPVLPTKNVFDDFIDFTDIYVNDELIKIDKQKIPYRFGPAPPLPLLTDSNVMVCHGEFFHGYARYETDISGPFSLKDLRLNFIDCGDNGYVLQSISYKGKEAFCRENAEKREYLKLQFVVKNKS